MHLSIVSTIGEPRRPLSKAKTNCCLSITVDCFDDSQVLLINLDCFKDFDSS